MYRLSHMRNGINLCALFRRFQVSALSLDFTDENGKHYGGKLQGLHWFRTNNMGDMLLLNVRNTPIAISPLLLIYYRNTAL